MSKFLGASNRVNALSVSVASNANVGAITHSLTANRTFTLPDKDGTFAMMSDVGSGGITLASALTGFTLGTDGTALSAADTILQGYQKLQVQANAKLSINGTASLTITKSSATPFFTSTRSDLANSVTFTHSASNLFVSSAQIQLPSDPAAALQAATKQYVDTQDAAIQPASIAAAVGPWTDYTPVWTSSGTQPSIGNGGIVGKWRRVGDSMEVAIAAVFGTTTTYGTGTYNFSLPPGYTFTDYAHQTLGQARLVYPTHNSGLAWASSTTTLGVLVPAGWIGQTVPVTWASGNEIDIRATIPISQWTANINLIQDFTEYISCDGTAGVAANTTYTPTTIYGSTGSLIPSVTISSTTATTYTTYRLTTLQQIKATDLIILEVNSGNGWINIEGIGAHSIAMGGVANSVPQGMWFNVYNSNTIQVCFSNAGTAPGVTYGTAGQTWAGFSSWKWRIRKTSNGNFAQGSPSYSQTIGDGSSTTIDITHSLGVTDCAVSIWELSGNKRKVDSGVDIRSLSSTQVRLVFTTAPASNALRVTIFSSGGTSSNATVTSWTPTVVGLSGATTAITGCYLIEGSKVTFSCQISVSSGTLNAGTFPNVYISNLPIIANSAFWGSVPAVRSDGVSIGACQINGGDSKVYLPTFTALASGNAIRISGIYLI